MKLIFGSYKNNLLDELYKNSLLFKDKFESENALTSTFVHLIRKGMMT